MMKPYQTFWIIGVLFLCTSFSFTYLHIHAQTKAEIQQQLQHMTPDEINAAIQKYGLTQADAEAKAKELGIDLETYLRNRAAATTPPAQVNIQIQPGTTQPAAQPVTGQPATQPAAGQPTTQPATVQPTIQPVAVQPTAPPVTPPKEQPPIVGPGEIPYFGYNLFKTVTAAFEPRPVLDEQYLVGEGDVLGISLWGELQSYTEYTVGKDGRILVNSVGPVFVSGYTLEKVRGIIQNTMAKAFSGLKKSPPTIFMDISIARIRPVRIFMMGEIENPGGYSVSSFSNVFNSLFSVGGPKLSGSLREVRVIRNNKAFTKVDLYDYLIGSEKTNDFRINDNDIIYVPLRGRTVAIKGAVLRSAYFELLPNEQLKRLLDFSGGIRNTFYMQRIQVDRIVPFAERKKGEPDRKIFDINFEEILKSSKDYKLEDGDIITIFPILDEKKNFVVLDGAVWRPGTYQLEKISTVKDLVKAADGFHPEAFAERAKLVRTYDNKTTEIFYIDPSRALQGDPVHNMVLEPRDSLHIFSRHEMLAEEGTISLEGMAKHPGTYPRHEKLTLYDIVYDEVGLTDTLFRKQVYLPRADLIRLNQDRTTTRIVTFNLWDLFAQRIGDTLLLSGDRVMIYPVTAIEFKDRYVDIGGKVKSPGRYKLAENMTLFDLLMQAGGYTEDAWAVEAELARLERTGLGKDSLSRITFAQLPDLFDTSKIHPEAIANYRATSLPLQHRDQVFIRPNPKYIFQQTVTVDGEVEHPGTYVISTLNERLSDVIKRAGGLKKSGYAEGGRVIRGGSRMRINIYDALDDPEGNNDIKLQPGDTISIPQNPFTVRVTGEVNNPGIFSYIDGKSLSFYIKQSGSETDSADFALVTFPTGMVEQAGLHWWSKNPKIPDGSSIYLFKIKPEPIDTISAGPKTTTYDFVKDILAILVSSVTVIVLATKL